MPVIILNAQHLFYRQLDVLDLATDESALDIECNEVVNDNMGTSATEMEFGIYDNEMLDLSDVEYNSDLDCDGFPVDPFADTLKKGYVRVEKMDEVTETLQKIISSGYLCESHFFYKLLKNALLYIDYHRERQDNHSLQFKWDPEVVMFAETLEYHGHEKVLDLLTGKGHRGTGRGGIKHFDPSKWNWPLPGKKARNKKNGYTTDDGIHANKLRSFLEIAGSADSKIVPLYEDEHVKLIPAFCAKDGMAIKPGLVMDKRQGKLIGSKINIDYSYIKSNQSPDFEEMKASMVQEAECITITTGDQKVGLPIGANYLSKKVDGMSTLSDIKTYAHHCQICLEHLKQHKVPVSNGVIISSPCQSLCTDCLENDPVTPCSSCETLGIRFGYPALRPCSLCQSLQKKCVKAVVLLFSMDSESRNSKAQSCFEEQNDKTDKDPYLMQMQLVPDSVHMAKRIRQSFSNWFIWVNESLVNVVLLRELRIDKHLKSELQPHLTINSVRNRDRQDVDSLAELGAEPVLKVLQKVGKVVHTVVPEKFRVTNENKPGIFAQPVAICASSGTTVFVADIGKNAVFKVRVGHYPAGIDSVVLGLDKPLALSYHNGILFIAECNKNRIVFRDITGCTVLQPASMTVVMLKQNLKDLGLWKKECETMKKKQLQSLLQNHLNELKSHVKHSNNNSGIDILDGIEVEMPSSLHVCKCGETDMVFVGNATMTGQILCCEVKATTVSIAATVIKIIQTGGPVMGLTSQANTLYYTKYSADDGGLYSYNLDTGDANCAYGHPEIIKSGLFTWHHKILLCIS